ncbi:uncharacterized protein LOC127845665 isoform X2 [Dreissena polymorpha]|uniref:Speriolin C-terminal domain-containing protein n=1 Tax=Dreissena polymorpha TaxID=45954 RepID=A0A9D4IJQ2_DREPO|nr:uncharacterized protein LOC127845665 isoform X2 [Dreissena polymorpha]KAH3775132.1 hypothetical protein DPMN_176529 [Dreissena polymorpha]
MSTRRNPNVDAFLPNNDFNGNGGIKDSSASGRQINGEPLSDEINIRIGLRQSERKDPNASEKTNAFWKEVLDANSAELQETVLAIQDENNALRRCLQLMQENSSLKAANVLGAALSILDDKLRYFVTGKLLTNSQTTVRKGEPKSIQSSPHTSVKSTGSNKRNRGQIPLGPKRKSIATPAQSVGGTNRHVRAGSRSFGQSFPEIDYNDIAHSTARNQTLLPGSQPDAVSPSYGASFREMSYRDTEPSNTSRVVSIPNSPLVVTIEHKSPGSDSRSYGKSFQEINYSDLAQSPTSNRESVSDSPVVVKINRRTVFPESPSYGQSFREMTYSDIADRRSFAVANGSPTVGNSCDTCLSPTPNSPSYGKAFQSVNISDLNDRLSDSVPQWEASRQEPISNTKRQRTQISAAKPPMKFGLNPSPLQSRVSARTEQRPRSADNSRQHAFNGGNQTIQDSRRNVIVPWGSADVTHYCASCKEILKPSCRCKTSNGFKTNDTYAVEQSTPQRLNWRFDDAPSQQADETLSTVVNTSYTNSVDNDGVLGDNAANEHDFSVSDYIGNDPEPRQIVGYGSKRMAENDLSMTKDSLENSFAINTIRWADETSPAQANVLSSASYTAAAAHSGRTVVPSSRNERPENNKQQPIYDQHDSGVHGTQLGPIQKSTQTPATSMGGTIRHAQSDSPSFGQSFPEMDFSNIAHSTARNHQTPAMSRGGTNRHVQSGSPSYGQSFPEMDFSNIVHSTARNHQIVARGSQTDPMSKQFTQVRELNEPVPEDRRVPVLTPASHQALGMPQAASTPVPSPGNRGNSAGGAHMTVGKDVQTSSQPVNKHVADNVTFKSGSNPQYLGTGSVIEAVTGKSSSSDNLSVDCLFTHASSKKSSGRQDHTDDSLVHILGLKGDGSLEKAKYVFNRPVDQLTGYLPHITYDVRNSISILCSSRHHARLIGEVAFQLDRRILEHVFSDVTSGHTARGRSRFYGYSVANVNELIEREDQALQKEGALGASLHHKLKALLSDLASFSYNIRHHGEFTREMVNKYGLLVTTPDPETVERLGLNDPGTLRLLIGRILRKKEEFEDMLIILDCLCFIAYKENAPLLMW